MHGDFVETADDLPHADVVTLDRVIRCYPHLERLLAASLGRTARILGLVYPRERWGTRVAANLWFRVLGSTFRTYLHSPGRVQAFVKLTASVLTGPLVPSFGAWRPTLGRSDG